MSLALLPFQSIRSSNTLVAENILQSLHADLESTLEEARSMLSADASGVPPSLQAMGVSAFVGDYGADASMVVEPPTEGSLEQAKKDEGSKQVTGKRGADSDDVEESEPSKKVKMTGEYSLVAPGLVVARC